MQVDIGESAIGLLKLLSEQDLLHLTQSQIAPQLSISESTLCTLIEKLRHEGFLVRERMLTDRRKTKIGLTEMGLKVVNDIQKVEIKLDGLLKLQLTDKLEYEEHRNTIQELLRAIRLCPSQIDASRRAA
ncbi:MAG: MarR family transcriptional regulator [Planctomicrobium sp.]|nr:MarR family transcriptional regulator [Planctomicrobium sp.]